jgi:hypothetical protein
MEKKFKVFFLPLFYLLGLKKLYDDEDPVLNDRSQSNRTLTMFEADQFLKLITR